MSFSEVVEQKLSNFTKEELAYLAIELEQRSERFSLPAITQVELLLTQKCNHKCDYCWVREDVGMSMSIETAIKAIDLAVANSRGADITIIFLAVSH